MKRFKNILFVSDQDRSALKRALALAKTNRAQLTVVDVIEELPQRARIVATVKPPQDLQQLIVNDRKERLEKFVAPFRKKGTRVNTNVLVGKPFQEIILEVVRKKRDLVVVTTEDTDRAAGLKQKLFGSTSMHLMRQCPCPVWVMKSTRHNRYKRIVAAVDPDSFNEDANHLDTKIMDLATSLSQMERSTLHIVHAWNLFGEELLRNRISADNAEEWVTSEHRRHRTMIDQLLQQYSLPEVDIQTHLVKGKAAAVIPALVEHVRADLLIMGTVCRTGVAGFFIGNTAEEVLQQVECSVLTVKPDRFLTPVL